MNRYKKYSLVLLALLAFAGNSVLCRFALADEAIDPISFTVLRLLSGAFVLTLLLFLFRRWSFKTVTTHMWSSGHWWTSVCLLLYALLFSIAYTLLDTGVGALILFGVVQIVMISHGVIHGRKLALREAVGVFTASLGVAYLLWPEESMLGSPHLLLLAGVMMLSGVAWGLYSLAGASSGHADASQALIHSATNFLRTLPLLLLVLPLYFLFSPTISYQGVILAMISGAITSGIGYAIWYVVLPHLASVQAAVVQLLVPIFAAMGGVLFVQEVFTLKLLIASLLVLGGIALVVIRRNSNSQ